MYPPSVIGHYRVKTDDEGLKQKLEMMKQLSELGKRDPYIHGLVGEILWGARVKGKDQQGEVQALVKWYVDNVPYRRDIESVETFQHPRYTLTYHRGDCDDASVALAAMLGSVGYSTQFRVIRTKGANTWNHVYLVVELPRGSGKWVPIDATMPQMGEFGFGWEAPQSVVAQKMDYPLSGLQGIYEGFWNLPVFWG